MSLNEARRLASKAYYDGLTGANDQNAQVLPDELRDSIAQAILAAYRAGSEWALDLAKRLAEARSEYEYDVAWRIARDIENGMGS